MICTVKPYEGQEPYIFFSYCHDDQDIVYPIMEQMGTDGYRIWYDDGIHPGADWPAVIAEHIDRCAIFIAAVTSRSAESHNCRNEIIEAVNENKAFVPIIMEKFQMPLGIKFQLGSGQYIVKYNISSESDFFTKLYQSQGLETCRGRQSQIDPVRVEMRWREKKNGKSVPQKPTIAEESSPQIQSAPLKPQEELLSPEPNEEKTPPRPRDEKNGTADWGQRGKRITPTTPQEEDFTPTRVRLKSALLIHVADGACFPLSQQCSTIGRDPNCVVCLDDRYVERNHAEITQKRGAFCLLAHKSVNGTALNGKELGIEENTPLTSPSMLEIAGEAYLFLAGDDAERAEKTRLAAFLECVETQERKALGATSLPLGQNHPWENGTLSDNRVSREHGRIVPIPGGGYGYEAHKERRTNGTYYNGDEIEPGERFVLCDGDRLGLGKSCHLLYQLIELPWEGEK